ncbi:MAG: hypothetical protein EZS28_007570 [Streblomastix strix]|uniref:Uncharacterized protein n=1 Tax=Streblomastix strix TaxID=222440 RepID=A0A5J4WQB5_9EUKA|nr:MAG: hypothetical protein EZS28_007565 [Streblomastix strix]KAA6396908.1 MAG: hypothetical protein EZS28_007570 [Streblomastix strix]
MSSFQQTYSANKAEIHRVRGLDDRVKHDTMISNSISTDIVTKSDLARKELHKDAILDAILAIGPDAIENPNPFPDEDVYVLSLHKRMDNIEARVDALKHTLALNRDVFFNAESRLERLEEATDTVTALTRSGFQLPIWMKGDILLQQHRDSSTLTLTQKLEQAALQIQEVCNVSSSLPYIVERLATRRWLMVAEAKIYETIQSLKTGSDWIIREQSDNFEKYFQSERTMHCNNLNM